MEYFPPKSFITWGTVAWKQSRRGYFKIEPVNNQYNNELYLAFSYMEAGKYYAGANNYPDFRLVSPAMTTEEEAIRWLEKELCKIAKKKIAANNKKLAKEINDNKKFLARLTADLF